MEVLNQIAKHFPCVAPFPGERHINHLSHKGNDRVPRLEWLAEAVGIVAPPWLVTVVPSLWARVELLNTDLPRHFRELVDEEFHDAQTRVVIGGGLRHP